MSNVRLSFCIPTYNFGEFIGETLESIVRQGNEEVEIVVGDGASTDNTAEVVRRYQSQFPRLTYRNFGKKGGIDLDLAKTVELASGDYCWLMSSDDVLKRGAIQRVLNEIELGHDVYLLNRTTCDRNLKPRRRQRLWLSPTIGDSVFHLTDQSELLCYLNASNLPGSLFSYISSIIVRRGKWNASAFDDRLSESNYAHVFRLFSILKVEGNSLKYIKESFVVCRGENDSFQHKGICNRLRIDFDGFQVLAELLFPEEPARRAFKAVLRRALRWYTLARMKGESKDGQEWKKLKEVLSNYGYSPKELLLIDLLGSSKLYVSLMQMTKEALRL